MGYREDMERCRAYIAEHLDEEIEARALADRFGYSYFHFCHVFRSVNGMAVFEYLRDSRLCRAAEELLSGQRVTDAALSCGFDTVSGFTRAFRRKFGVSPSDYKKQKGVKLTMTPEIKKMDAFTAIGYSLKPESEIDTHESGAYWLGKDFSTVSLEDYQKIASPTGAEVGMWVRPECDDAELYYFFGPVAVNADYVPAGMKAIAVAEAEYAVFKVPAAEDVKGLHENVQKTWKFIFNDWFDGSEYCFDQSKADFEYYLGADTYIYVPVVKK